MADHRVQKKAGGRTPKLVQAEGVEALPATGLVRTASGEEFYFEDSGGPGPVLFYIYGLGCSIAHWKYQLPYFAHKEPGASKTPRAPRTYRQVWLDFRGHGKSPPLQQTPHVTMGDVVEDIVELCRLRGITKATFLGQSLGGAIVLLLARDHPDLTASLVLLTSPVRDPSATLPAQPVSRWLWQAVTTLSTHAPSALRHANKLNHLMRQQPLLALPMRELIRNKGFNPQLAQTSDVDEYLRQLLGVDFQLFAAMAAELSEFDGVRFAHRVTCPVLLIAGANDYIVPLRETQRLARHLPDAQLVVIPHGSHCPHFDDPHLVNATLATFLSKHA